MHLNVAYNFLPRTSSTRVSQVMDHFGIDFEQGAHVVASNLELPVAAGQIVLFTGASGSGKSSLLRAVQSQLAIDQPQARVVDLDTLDLGNRLLIDALLLPVDETMQLLSSCGLGEAHLMLRTPAELSEGQRYRYRLALALSQRPDWIVADEFTATLDRTLAKAVAFNLRRVAHRSSVGCLLATTHEDVADDLAPDLHVRCDLDGCLDVSQHGASAHTRLEKKDPSRSRRSCGSARAPAATGRISLGGIIAAITSD